MNFSPPACRAPPDAKLCRTCQVATLGTGCAPGTRAVDVVRVSDIATPNSPSASVATTLSQRCSTPRSNTWRTVSTTAPAFVAAAATAASSSGCIGPPTASRGTKGTSGRRALGRPCQQPRTSSASLTVRVRFSVRASWGQGQRQCVSTRPPTAEVVSAWPCLCLAYGDCRVHAGCSAGSCDLAKHGVVF